MFEPDLVISIYRSELGGGGVASTAPAQKRVMLLEVSLYLENYLWPNFVAATASYEHIMSIVLMVNEKFREGVPAWTCFHTREVRSHRLRFQDLSLFVDTIDHYTLGVLASMETLRRVH